MPYFSVEERFWANVDIKSSNECWKWKTVKHDQNYGGLRNEKKKVGAHRFAWELYNKCKVPDDKYILHTCDNPSCCNPTHLYCGTLSDNRRDAIRRGRVRYNNAFSSTGLYAREILGIKKLNIPMSKLTKKRKYSQRLVAKMFGTSSSTVGRIWNSEKYPCKEGYYV